ncbi:potassium/sodium hyperpolarization-activated cyclic nucleotide-gated channel 1-like [Leptopilina heterotoma]|uniref:potassium/sodium hyperpolarization-activated cyclic nucleotide-gated channel 1-like n=1 Tax=Leptopilina heterotoma TaxID=63436 RepID=UPI001CA98325|nr:potassium/sodium hyperpolarization-activated cyclic nucleotide-gated channel 1-like [Leptopilina heterotoma]
MELLAFIPEVVNPPNDNQNKPSIIDHKCNFINQNEKRNIFLTNGLFTDMRQWIRNLFIMSRKLPFARNILKSTAAVNYEINRQIKFYPYMIHPFSRFRVCWVMFLVTFTILALFVIPVLNAFYFEMQKDWYPITIFIDIIFLLDIILNFLTGYYDIQTRNVIFDMKIVAQKYFGSYFFLDLLTIFPEELIDYLVCGMENTKWYIPIFNFMKIITLRNIMKGTEYLKKTFRVSIKNYEIIKLTLIVSITIHWSACLEYYVPQAIHKSANLPGRKNSWILSEVMLSKTSRIQKYIFSLQRATTALVSSSHILPVFTLEDMILNLVLSMFGRLGFIYLLFKFVEISNLYYSSTKKRSKHLRQLREFMKMKELPENTQNRLLAYYDYYNKRNFDREKIIFSQVTPHLRQELILHRCKKLFDTVVLFQHLPQEIKIKVAESIEPKIYLPDDEIVKANTPGELFFYIVSGTVAVYSSKGKEICHLDDGCYFGDISLVMKNETRIASVYAIEICEMFVLSRDNFLQAINNYPGLLNRLQKVALQTLEFMNLPEESTNTEQTSFPMKSVNISNIRGSRGLFS